MQRITLIGNGAMASAIAHGLKGKYYLDIVGRNLERTQKLAKELGAHAQAHTLEGYDIQDQTVIVCVKPANIAEVAKALHGKADLLVSILAGIDTATLRKHFKAKHTVRAMPNLAARIGKSLTTLTGDETAKERAEVLFHAIGKTLWLESDNAIDIATALAGSGPAYLALVAEAMADGGVKEGLKRDDALKVLQGLFEGFGSLLQEMSPTQLKDSVMSPGGTTAAGYSALEKSGVRGAFIEAIERAYAQAVKLRRS